MQHLFKPFTFNFGKFQQHISLAKASVLAALNAVALNMLVCAKSV